MRSTTGAVILAVLLSQPTWAEDFRVATTIGEGDTIQAETTTIFYRGRVFDLSDPKGKEFTVFDPRLKVIHLIDLDRMMQTSLTTAHLDNFTKQLKIRAPQVKRAFLINPQFAEVIGTNQISLTSPRISYEVDTIKPRWPKAVDAYMDFANWYCQLNATNTRNLPPFPRMELNAALSRNHVLPETVRLRLPIGSNVRVIEAKHRYFWVLSRKDRELCEAIGGHLVEPEVRRVEFGQYRKKALLANGSSSAARK